MNRNKWRFTTKLFLCFVATILVSIMINTASFLRQSVYGMYSLGESAIVGSHTAVFNALEMYRKKTQGKMAGDLSFFEGVLQPKNQALILENDEERMETRVLVDQITGDGVSKKIPKIQAGYLFLNEYFEFVDDVKAKTGDELVTIFVLFDEKLIRISNTVASKDGGRVLWTYISSTAEAYREIVRKGSYYGKELVGSDWYFTAYRSLKDIDGEIIGAICVGTPMLSEEVKTYVVETKVAKGAGDFFLYNEENGEYLVHAGDEPRFLGKDSPGFVGAGGGFVEYGSRGREKVAYVKPLGSWGALLGVNMERADLIGGLDRTLLMYSAVLGAIVLVVGIVAAFFIVRTINKPLKELAEKSALVGTGDYTVNFAAGAAGADDAIGRLSESLNDMIGKQREMIGDVVSSSQVLATSSAELSAISEQMVASADLTSQIAAITTSHAGEVAGNMHSVSAAMEQSTTNLGMIATAAEEMSSTIDEIAQNSAHARLTTETAVKSAKTSRDNVAELSEAAKSIGVITETIAEISKQTNLLALNATIEAARAGEAGKGFSVVANEIKELAHQTAYATSRIKDSITHIQNQTSLTVGSIQAIADIIDEVDQSVNSIVTAVEEQSVTTNEIVRNVSQASQGVFEINENVASSSLMTGTMAQNVGQVREQSAAAKENSRKVQESAGDLAILAGKLTKLVEQFKVQ